VKAWDEVRKILSETTAAKLNGVTAGMFSFNTVGGRCDVCEGAGTVTIDMQFLADVEVVCDKCGGKRFNEQVMKVTYKNRNVNDILKMTVDEAMKFFVDKRALLKKLAALRSVGMPARLNSTGHAEFRKGNKWLLAPSPSVISW